jgi:YVTN family beta-propeller protein
LIYSTADKGALLVTTDFATGETKVIGPTGQSFALGLACDGAGTLYTVTHAFDTNGESQLAKFDLTTGEARPYGEKNSLQFMGLTFTPDGTLYAAGFTDGALYTINLETGVPTKIGDLGDARDAMDLTIHPNGNMYGIDPTGAIFQIDPKTAKATLVVKVTGFTFPMGLGFDAEGTGYVADLVPLAPIYRIDLATGQITGTVNTTLNFLHSAEIMVAPRPRLTEANHEVWMIDQSNTYDSDGNGTLDCGGTLYIYNFDGSELAANAASTTSPQRIDLGGAIAEWIKQATGTVPVRPHYVAFNPSHTHAIVSFVGSGHVLIFDAATRTPVFTVDVGAQVHAAEASPDETYILVTNQNGKLLQRINTDYLHNAFALDAAATLDLAAGTTPSGALKQDDGVTQSNVRPDTAPIMAMPDPTSTLAFVTLRGGGLFVVNPRVSPMAIVGEFTKATIPPAGLMAVMKGETLYLNAGGGGATLPFQSILNRLAVNEFSTTPILAPDFPAPVVVFDHNARPERDSHGMIISKDERYLWVGDRAANRIIVVDTATNSVVNEINLAGNLSADPAPDFLALSPSGNRVYVVLRGPNPLTSNNTNVNNAKGLTPGLGVIQVEQAGMAGTLQTLLAISHLDGAGVERADPHGLAVRYRYFSILHGGNGVTISWPISTPEFVLESATNLSLPKWEAATGVPTTNTGKWQITDLANVTQRYFRLRKP